MKISDFGGEELDGGEERPFCVREFGGENDLERKSISTDFVEL